jgi:von Willebrand factor type A domain
VTPERRLAIARAVWPWLLVVGVIAVVTVVTAQIYQVRIGVLSHELGRLVRLAIHPNRSQEGAIVEWRSPRAVFLVAGAGLVGLLAFHLHRRRAAAMAYSQVALVHTRGAAAWLADLPGVLRVVAVAALAIALARPETYRVVKHEVDSIDIMLVVDMSKSMEETDMQRDRLDAAQRVIRRFLHRTKNDRIGLVVFGQQAMLQCPLTQDTRLLA